MFYERKLVAFKNELDEILKSKKLFIIFMF